MSLHLCHSAGASGMCLRSYKGLEALFFPRRIHRPADSFLQPCCCTGPLPSALICVKALAGPSCKGLGSRDMEVFHSEELEVIAALLPDLVSAGFCIVLRNILQHFLENVLKQNPLLSDSVGVFIIPSYPSSPLPLGAHDMFHRYG